MPLTAASGAASAPNTAWSLCSVSGLVVIHSLTLLASFAFGITSLVLLLPLFLEPSLCFLCQRKA